MIRTLSLLTVSFVLFSSSVWAQTACVTDEDCGACAVCIDGECKGTGLVMCTSDADCASGEKCHVDSANPCMNYCGPAEPECVTSDDCGACSVCVDGQCFATPGVLMCESNADCAPGEVCIIDSADPCNNYCTPDGQACTSDEDCEACSSCFDGQCIALPGVLMCQSDADCAPGEVCIFDSTDHCNSYCAPVGQECSTDEDCGACSSCMDGQCIVLPGLPMCETDADCGPDEVCVVDSADACNNYCSPQGIECTTDEDCGACAVCIDGGCMGLGAIMCESDADCNEGESCVIDSADPCKNYCTSEEPTCITNEDCGPCAICADGECKGLGDVSCTADEDCPEGQICSVNDEYPCMNECVPNEQECTTDEQCGSCAVCVDGECKGTGVVICTKDEDCNAGEVCDVHNTDPCKNACVPFATECATDEDCSGQCTSCVEGTCQSLGSVACTTDAECGQGKKCQVDAADSCKNKCVNDDGSSGTPNGGDQPGDNANSTTDEDGSSGCSITGRSLPATTLLGLLIIGLFCLFLRRRGNFS